MILHNKKQLNKNRYDVWCTFSFVSFSHPFFLKMVSTIYRPRADTTAYPWSIYYYIIDTIGFSVSDNFKEKKASQLDFHRDYKIDRSGTKTAKHPQSSSS